MSQLPALAPGGAGGLGANSNSRTSPEIPEVPILTVEEEMQYQRALWLNRLLKEQLAQLTHNLSIEEIDMAKEQLQAQLGISAQSQGGFANPGGGGGGGWIVGGESTKVRSMPFGSKMISPRGGSTGPGAARTMSQISPRRVQQASSSAVNRKKREAQIDRENLGFLRRLQNVKSSFHQLPPPTAIPKLSANSRLLQPSRRDALGILG